jgi:AcrR family transcriptional regulator
MVTSKRRVTPLTRDELTERALAIVDAQGLQALTMRRLAADAGVEAASLYHHVPNKEALLDAVLVRIRSEVRPPDPLPGDLLEIMAAVFTEYHRVLAAHPNLIAYAARRVESDPQSGLLGLMQAGFCEEDAVGLWQSVLAFVVGFAMFSSQAAGTDVDDLPDSTARRLAAWRAETFTRTLRVILNGYAESRTRSGSASVGE